jgi:methionine aminopeptidase
VTEAEVLEKYREAGRILAEVRTDAIKTIKVGKKLLDAAESIETFPDEHIRERGGSARHSFQGRCVNVWD